MIPIDPNTIGGKSGGPSKFAQAGGVTAALDGVMQLGSAAAPIIKNIGMSTDERSNDKGHLTHEVNTGGNVLSMGSAGAKAGSMFGPWGTAIGAVGGALVGGVMSIIDKNKQPTLDELIAKNKSFNTQQHVKTIASNDTFVQQAQAAEDGLKDVNGTKKIEVEKDEIILRKVGKTFKKVADFTGGKSHSQGGEDYIAEQGDIIFPGKQRELVNRALRTRDWKRLESMRAALPPDTVQPQKANGVNSIETDPEKKRLATTKPIPESGTAKYPAIHIPKNDDPEKQADFRAAYAKRMGLSDQQVSGFLDQRESDIQYYKDKTAFLNTHMKEWRANPKHSQFTMVSPEYRAAIEGGTKAWYDKNPRMVNDVVYDYYNNGPAVNNNIQKEFTSVNTSKEPIKYKEGTSGIDVYQDGTKGIQTGPIKKHKIKGMSKGKRKSTDSLIIHRTAGGGKFNPKDTRMTRDHLGAHFWIEKDGTLHQINDVEDKLWHAGNMNDKSIGIEVVGKHISDDKWEDLTPEQEATLKKLSGSLVKEYNIPKANIQAHIDVGKKTAGEGSTAAQIVRDFIDTEEYKNTPTFSRYSIEESDLEPSERVQAMRDANIKKLGYEPYEDYSSRTIAEGGEPESEAWYDQNVIAPLNEKKRGYWTMDSPKGRANYDADGVIRGDAQLEFHALSNKEKADKLKEARVAFPDNPYLQNLEDKGYFDEQREQLERIMGEHFKEGMFESGMKDARRPGILNDIIHAGTDVFGNWFGRTTEENVDNDYHGITDKKLKEEALAFRSYLANNKDNGTLLGRKMHQAFNFLDRAVVAGLEGIEGLDDGAQVSTGIANLLTGEDPEVVEKLINDAKAAGVLSEKGANYAWHIATDPEVFKNQTAEAVEDVNVIMAIKDAPRLIRKAWNGLPGAWKTAKGWAQAIKSGKLTKDGQLTAKGFRAIRNSKDLRMKLKAAKNAKNSTAAKKLEKQLSGLYGGSFELKGTETFAEMEALAKTIDDANIPMGNWKSSTKEAVSFFNNQWKSLKKLPSKALEKLGGKKFSEIADMERELAKITGKTPKELRSMSGAQVAKIVTETRKTKFQTLQDAIKAKDEAWKAYKPLKENLASAKKALEEAGAAGKSLDTAQEEVRLAEEALQQGASTIEDLEKLTKTNWDQIGKIEAWESTPEVATKFRQLVQGEQAIARHTENLKGLEGSLKTAKADQAVWKGIQTEAVGVENSLEMMSNAFKLRDEGLATARAAQATANRAQGAVNTYETLAKSAPKLHAEIAKHADMMKTLKAGGRFTPAMYNILRKGDGIDVEGIESEAESIFTPEEIEKAGQKREPVKSVGLKRMDIVPIETEGPTGTMPEVIEPTGPTPEIGKTKDGKLIGKIAGTLDSLAEYAPAIYNITKGLEKPDKITRRFVTPQTKEYHNMSQPQLNAIDAAFEGAISNARNMSGGMMSNFRANTEAAWAEKIARAGAVNAHEAGRSDAIASENINIRNKADEINTQTHQKADIIDMQSEAATNSFLAQGISDVANISAVHKKDRNAEKNQNMVLKMMGEGRPFTAGEDGSIKFTG